MEETCLVQALREGDQTAFRTLYEDYHGRLYGFSLRFVKSPALAEEVVHDVFLKIWEHRATLRTDSSFRSYLFTIAKNHLLTLLQRANQEARIKQEIADHLPTSHCQPEEQVIYNDYLHYAQQAIASLPPQRRLVFETCRLQGKSYEEAAQLLAISPGTVKDHIIKAKKAIRHYLRTKAQITISVLAPLVWPWLT
jgi:RNA polymerase sigma-70 factor (ECF subfamily)